MSDTDKIDMAALYEITLREAETDEVQELKDGLYASASEYVGQIRLAEYDGIEEKIKDELVDIVTRLIGLLIKTRIRKATAGEAVSYARLTDEEKYIVASYDEMQSRLETILSAILHGKTALLESTTEKHKTKLVAVRFLKGMDQFVGVDMEAYGPFDAESVANIPYENAQSLIMSGKADKINWDDDSAA